MARALLVGGYDDVVKRGIIVAALEAIAAEPQDPRVLLIRDHFDPEPIDALGLKIAQETISGGCFCCSLKQDFELLMRQRRDHAQLIIEVPLIADMDSVASSISQVHEGCQVGKVFALEPENLRVMLETLPELMGRNVTSADAIAWSDTPSLDGPESLLGGRWRGKAAGALLISREPPIRASMKDRAIWPF